MTVHSILFDNDDSLHNGPYKLVSIDYIRNVLLNQYSMNDFRSVPMIIDVQDSRKNYNKNRNNLPMMTMFSLGPNCSNRDVNSNFDYDRIDEICYEIHSIDHD